MPDNCVYLLNIVVVNVWFGYLQIRNLLHTTTALLNNLHTINIRANYDVRRILNKKQGTCFQTTCGAPFKFLAVFTSNVLSAIY